MRTFVANVLGAAALVASAGVAEAQVAAGPRGYLVVNGVYQLTSSSFTVDSTFRQNAEDGQYRSDYTVEASPGFDVAGGIRLWRRLAVGAGISRVSRATPTTLQGSVPHPFFFDRDRSFSGDVAGLKRDELVVHLQARAVVPIGPRLQLMAFGGPSFFQVRQGLVAGFTVTESYPYDEVSFSTARTTTAKESTIGFNAGADLAFFFTSRLGIGGTLQFAGGSVKLQSEGSDGVRSVSVGGVRAGAGLRVRF